MNVADKFLGQTKLGAQRMAEMHNLIFRLIRIGDKNFLNYPEDVREDRVCVELDNGEVVKATIQ